MKTTGFVEVDLSSNPIGLRNRSLDDFLGKPVLRRFAESAVKSRVFNKLIIAAPSRDMARIKDSLSGIDCVLYETDAIHDDHRRKRFRAARKWSLSSWSGGIGRVPVYEEECNIKAAYDSAKKHGCDSFMMLPSHSPFFDEGLARRLVDTLVERRKIVDFMITPAPAGFNYKIFLLGQAGKMILAGASVKDILDPKPDQFIPDPVVQEFFMRLEERIFSCEYRFTCDSDHHASFLNALASIAGGGIFGMTCAEMIKLADDNPSCWTGGGPRELEIEIADGRSASPGLMDASIFNEAADYAASFDDVKLTIGGYGEPTAHPELQKFISYARRKGVYGVHFSTNGTNIEDALTEAMISNDGPDAVSFRLDAIKPETYQSLRGMDELKKVMANVERLIKDRNTAKRFWPFVLVHFTKLRANCAEMEEFVEYWTDKADAVVLEGFNNLSGQIEDKSIMHLVPGRRGACRKLRAKMFISADGRVPMCEQDYKCRFPAGRVGGGGLGKAWDSGLISELRKAHESGDFGPNPLCLACKEWHRL